MQKIDEKGRLTVKIGCLTWWRNNYGSILQAYALQTYIEQSGGYDYEIINQYSAKMASVDNLIEKLKNYGLRRTVKRLVFRFGMPGLRARVSKLQQFVDDNLHVSENVFNAETISEANQYYDTFICGSDQIWNPANEPVDSMYWLQFVDKNKMKIAYAPSVGVAEFSEDEKRTVIENLKGFKAVSCREDGGTELLNAVVGKEICKTVLDPTLIVDKRVWDAICTPRKHEQKYIFAYMLRGTKEDRKMIETFAKKVGLPVVTIPFLDAENIVWYDIKFGDIKDWNPAPNEFISLIRHAEYIFTDSFHCMVFSTVYHKRFFMIRKLGKAQMQRIYHLQKKLCLGNRLVNADTVPEEIFQMEDPIWSDVDNAVNRYRLISRNYLDNALKEV